MRLLCACERLVTAVTERRNDPAVIYNASDGRALHVLFQNDDQRIAFLDSPPAGDKFVTAGFQDIYIWTVAGVLDRHVARLVAQGLAASAVDLVEPSPSLFDDISNLAERGLNFAEPSASPFARVGPSENRENTPP